jgi:hypothetical protein
VQGDERLVLERKVRDAVIRFLDRQRMGEPLLFSQLTREVLDVKGVTDLADFRISVFRDQQTAATGVVTLARGPGTPAGNLAIPARTELRAGTGQRFAVDGPVDAPDGEVVLAAGDREVEARVHAVRQGRDGELMRTGSSVAWEPTGAGLRVSNAVPVRLARTAYDTAKVKRVEAAVEERFVPDLVRVAAGDKTLVVQVLAYVAAPAAGGSAALAAAVQTAVANAGTAARPDDAWTGKLDTRARNAATAAVDGFFAPLRDAAAAEGAALTADLDEDTRAALEKAIRDTATGKGPVSEAALRDALNAVLAARLTPAVMAAGLDAPLAAALARLQGAALPAWPADAVATAIRTGLERAAAKTIADAQAKVADAQAAVQTQAAAERAAAAALAADPESGELQKKLADAQAELAKRQAALATTQGELATASTGATRELSESLDAVPARVQALRKRTQDALDALGTPAARARVLAGRTAGAPYALEVRLRTIDWEGAVLADAAYVEPSFVETVAPQPFVYTRRVALAGTLALALPLTATDHEKRIVREQVRQQVADLLDGLRPEESLELDRVRALAETHERVLRATFEPAAALAGRIDDGALEVRAMEKLVLGGDAFEIRA